MAGPPRRTAAGQQRCGHLTSGMKMTIHTRDALTRDLDRLWTAVHLFRRQQWERVMLGGREEYDDVVPETREVASEAISAIERALDEDLVEALNREHEMTDSTYGAYWPFWPGYPPAPRAAAAPWPVMPVPDAVVPSRRRREETLIDQVLGNFRAELLSDLRDARRDDRDLSAAEIDDLVHDLRSQLDVLLVTRTRRRTRENTRDVPVP
jgi:hypothetical protein